MSRPNLHALAQRRAAELRWLVSAQALYRAASEHADAARALAAATRACKAGTPKPPPTRRISRRACILGMAVVAAVGAAALWALIA